MSSRLLLRKTGLSLVQAIGFGALAAAALYGQNAPTIGNSSFPPGTVGTPYAQGFKVSGGLLPYTWSVTAGSLPPGLTVNSPGTITGTPTSGGTFTFTLTVVDFSQNQASKQFSITIAGPSGPKLSITTGTLTPGTVGVSYSQTLSSSGGTPPYLWALTSGALPAGLTLQASSGTIAGTPTAAGPFSFTISLLDANQNTATANFSLTINPGPLTITTVAPLFTGTVGVSYYEPFSASGGTPPYTWSLGTGSVAGLSLDATSGILSGTPSTAGSVTITVQVSDSAGARVSQTYTVVVNQPTLTITAGSPSSPVKVGAPYTQPFSATGGTQPYTWSANGLPAGLTINASSSASAVISGTPTAAGTFNITVQVKDAAGLTATRSLSVTVQSADLNITTARQLPDAALNAAYSRALVATGGIPPYTWSANGLPAGLTINASSGVISGTPAAAGNFAPAITVADSTQTTRFSDRFTLNVNLPAAPAVTISGLSGTVPAAQQFPLQVTLGSTYPAPLTGQVILGFQADTGPGDSTILFSTGGKTANFNIPTGSTAATFVDSNGAPVSSLQIQTGTVSGTISISLRLQAGGIDITPNPAPSITAQLVNVVPAVTSTLVSRSSNGISIAVTGYSTTREVTQAVFAFSAKAGQTLQSAASSITVDVTKLFSNFFSSSTQGSQFVFTQPFSVQGDPTAVIPVSVTLTNRIGTTTATIGQ